MDSIHTRLLGAATLVLAAFLGLTGWALDQAFRESARTAVRGRLQAQIYALLAAADLDPGGILQMPDALPEHRFSTPGSGIYGEVTAVEDGVVWRSPSLVGLGVEFEPPPRTGTFRFYTPRSEDEGLFAMSFEIVWESELGVERGFVFSVAESKAAFEHETAGFRGSLWGWLGGLAAVLLLLQGSIVRWGLAPLRRVADDLRAIESGMRDRLGGRYPRELRGLTTNLNALIARDQARLERYRNALGDLAHSLKTPLAIIQGIAVLVNPRAPELSQLREQVQRIDQIVDYQLQRAATSGRATLMGTVQLRPLVEKLLASLAKVYRDKRVQVQIDVSAEAIFRGDSGDLMELLGNLLDNAHKCCERRVQVLVRWGNDTVPTANARLSAPLQVHVDDDGPGIPPQLRTAVLQRGVRLDQDSVGQGIGLAVVRGIVEAYEGSLDIAESPLGGARVSVLFPQSQ